MLWGAVDFDGNVYIYDEHYEAEKPVSHHAEQIKKRNNENVNDWLIDPSCMSKGSSKKGQIFSVVDEYKDYGITFRPADNHVIAGLNRVNEYFKSNRLFIFKNCVNLIDEIGSYHWKRIKAGEEKNQPDEPVKKKDHACDALRYKIMSRPDDTEIKPPATKYGTEDYYRELQEEQARREEDLELYG